MFEDPPRSGVGLFEETKEARQALTSPEKEIGTAFPNVALKTLIVDVGPAEEDDKLKSLIHDR